jgi:4-amino-4-deoxy-L-arabinose transferase-like glycosyltransferase
MTTGRWRIGLVLFTAGLVLTRLPALLYAGAISDENIYSVVASVMLHGGKPYLDAVERKPPLLFAVYAAVFGLAGEYNWLALHLTAVAWTGATMLLLYLVAQRMFDTVAGCFAALLYGLFMVWADYGNLAFNGELLMNLPIVLALALTLGPASGRWRLELVLAGVLIGLAFLLKQPAGIAGLPLGLYLLDGGYRRARGFSRADILRQAAGLIAGFVASLGITAVVLRREGVLQEAIYWTVLDHLAPVGPSTGQFWNRALVNSGLFVVSTLPLVLAAGVSVWLGFRRERTLWEGRRPEFRTVVLLFLVSLLGVSASGQFLYHYYLQLLPPLVLLAAPVCGGIWRRAIAYPLRPGPRLLAGWLGLTAAVFLAVDSIGLERHRPGSDAGEWVRQHSRPGDRLFLWGEGAGVYLSAERLPATRYVTIFPLTGKVFGGYPASWGPRYEDSRILPGAWDHLWADLARHPARYFIDAESGDRGGRYPVARYPQLDAYIKRWYRQAYRAQDGVVYQRAGG